MALSGVYYAVVVMIAVGSLPVMRSADPDPVQDFCVADTTSKIFVNGAPCIDPKTVVSADFKTSALGVAGDTSANPSGAKTTITSIDNLPGVNTQGVALARIDFAPRGLEAPHVHPRATEIVFVIRGVILVGFVDTSDRFFSQTLKPGDVFVFPRALIHFLYNVADTPGLTISGFNSQNPGEQDIATAAFASDPSIPVAVLAKAFQISAQEVEKIRENLSGFTSLSHVNVDVLANSRK